MKSVKPPTQGKLIKPIHVAMVTQVTEWKFSSCNNLTVTYSQSLVSDTRSSLQTQHWNVIIVCPDWYNGIYFRSCLEINLQWSNSFRVELFEKPPGARLTKT